MCVCLLPLGGCWDMADVNQRTFVLAMGIDTTDDEKLFRYTFHCASPSGESSDVQSNKLSYVNFSIDSPSLILAIRELILNSEHTASFEHLKLLSLGSDYAEVCKLDDLDSLFRVATVHRKCSVVVSDGSASDLLVSSEGEDSTAVLSSLLSRYGRSDMKNGSDFSLQELFIKRQDDLSVYLPLISIMSTTDMNVSVSAENGKESDNVFFLDGLCSFVSGQYAGKLGEPELETIRLLNYEKSGDIIPVVTAYGTYYYHIISSHFQRECAIDDGMPRFSLSLSVTCELADSGGKPSGAARESDMERELKKRIERLVDFSRMGYGAEILGLETEARQSHARWFAENRERWQEIYACSDISVDVDCTILSHGYIC